MGLGPIFSFAGLVFGRCESGSRLDPVTRRGPLSDNMLRDDLTALLAPIVHDKGLELWELEYSPRSNGGLLRIYIDSPRGITVDDCADVSHAVSDALDAADPIPGYYTLEVSSPGLDRVLRTHDHFARFAGEDVRVEMKTAVGGRKRFGGPLLQVEQDRITVEVDGKPVTLPLGDIHRARLSPRL
jgi:ribosome maturation factor RimP